MAKKITDADGNTYVKKKPFYKRVWFWILIIILVIAGISVSSSGSSNGGEKVGSSTQSTKKTTQFYKIGDSVKVGKVTYKLTSVQTTTERNEYADTKPKNVFIVKYTVDNQSEDDVPVGTDLEAYGPDNKKLDSYALNTTLDAVAAGKQMDVTAAYGTDELGQIELQFSPLVSFDKAAKFKVNLK
ncbi:DUF4352 domain-containing protein [Dellaglioa algida]|uniref:DUF4352 domain-containing protein n=2 Tax=Dellaglioa algida TaxID=105612 RepID=A0A0R1HPX0_9LACO|nr:DUF4352 domain-containing protein [Dellaglioa algida]KRK46531.1 hypothetical protein FC66_GL000154 [Dellaglioa algida DSM 15638]MDK1716797.1 DUF4352 domain-containing protein [Dellaglioa algida]MDK1718619.1 DUF4352 domain-containing protein [Dellaglioa algida]MDK1720576.1 DUF4352 domain-containing protein [Dellaglioa algida]MDK1721739.1 DUF4352 domain-containing protein [Dellaglioa algida]